MNLVGLGMVLVVFGVIFASIVQSIGYQKAAILFGGAIFAVAWLMVGVKLMFQA